MAQMLKANRIDVRFTNADGEVWVLTFATRAEVRAIAREMDDPPPMTNLERSQR